MSSSRLHDVENVDAFCSRLVEVAIAKNGGYLRADQREEVHRFLVETTVVLARGFRPGAVTFERYASYLLLRRVNDWYRREFGDSRSKRRRPVNESLDVLMESEAHVPSAVMPSFEDEALTRVALGR